jgi:sugar fermentation stimulation protein A
MNVDIGGVSARCHCPSTGRISSIEFKHIPCLLSKSDDPARKTPYTVEAFSLDPLGRKDKEWIGINQNKANDYVDFFLRAGKLSRMTGKTRVIQREVRLGTSRIDFLINGKDFIEVKTPLSMIPCDGHPRCRQSVPTMTGFDRTIKHFGDISKSISHGSRAIILLCFMYKAKPFEVPNPGRHELSIVRAARHARSRGMENWQINLRIDKKGVELLDCFRLRLF